MAKAGKHTGALVTTLAKSLSGVIEAGTGAGSGKSFSKNFSGSPFPMQACVVTFEIMFDKGFEFGCRGKVGGLFVGTGSASGCNYSKDGASLRMMWEAGPPSTAFAYTYVPDGSQKIQPRELSEVTRCGQDATDKKFGAKMTPGNWYRIELGIKLNTVGKKDGVLYMAFENDSVVVNGVTWRTQNIPITKFSYNVFHGGPCNATRRSTLQLRNVEVHQWKD